ncbi:MAG: hypothetical protein IPG22_17055 [Acidobacteria bacterium]|nr:hypothetical protein [Acidobacteriota bacterium]
MKRSLIALFLLVTGVVGVGVVAVNVEAHTRTVKISVSEKRLFAVVDRRRGGT